MGGDRKGWEGQIEKALGVMELLIISIVMMVSWIHISKCSKLHTSICAVYCMFIKLFLKIVFVNLSNYSK